MSKRCSPKIIHHNKPDQQQHQNKYRPQFQVYRGKLCHSKVVPPYKIFLNYLQCFNVSRVHQIVRALFPTNPIQELLLARRLKFIYSNWAKLTQDLNILNTVKGSRFLFSKTITQPSSFKSGTIQACQGRIQGNVVERCNTTSITMQKLVSQQTLSYIKERWGQQTSNKFVASEQSHPIPASKNGGTEFITKYAPEGRPYVKARPKRRLLLCSSQNGIIEMCMGSVGRDTLRVPVSLFWSRSSSSNI